MSQIDSTQSDLATPAATQTASTPAALPTGNRLGEPNGWPRLQWAALYFFAVVGGISAIVSYYFDSATITNGAAPLAILTIGFGIYVFAGVRGMTIWSLVGLIVAMAMAWHHAFGEMWLRWFPGWLIHKGAGLTTRMSAGDSYYSHAPLVPIASLIIAVAVVHKRVGLPCKRTKGSTVWGGLMLGMSILMQWVAARGDVTFVAGFAMIGVIASLTLLYGGWPLLRAYILPIGFLFFMVPLPMDTVAKLNFGLKFFASEAAVWITNDLFGVPALLKGASIHLLDDPVTNEPKTLVVENVCSGLRSLISLICFASLFAMMCRVRGLWRVFMLAMALPLAVGCNIVRITSMTLVSHYDSVEAAGEGSWFHTFSGLMVFALALAALFGLEQLIAFAGRKLNRNWSDSRIMGYLDDMPPVKNPSSKSWHPIAVAALVYVFCLSVLYAYEESTMNRTNVAAKAVSATVIIDGATYISKPEKISKQEMSILQTEDYLKRRYFVSSDPNNSVDLTIIFSANNRKGTHPPDVCLQGGGGRIISKAKQVVVFKSQSDEGIVDREIDMKELISLRPVKLRNGNWENYRTLNLYVYKCGSSYTSSYLWQQVVIFVNGVVDRNASGALIRIDAPIGWDKVATAQDEARARDMVLKAAKVFMTEIDAELP